MTPQAGRSRGLIVGAVAAAWILAAAISLTLVAALAGLAGGLTAAGAPGGLVAAGAAPGGGLDGTAPAPGLAAAPALANAFTTGARAMLLPDGYATAPADAPAAVRGMIAAGNQIAGKPYLYGGGHGLALNLIAAAYDCSSSVAHLLYGGGLLPAYADMTSGEFERWGLPGPGRWVTIYASATHVFLYVAGLRWDTWNAAGPGDGSAGIGWHPLVRTSSGFVARHPAGL